MAAKSVDDEIAALKASADGPRAEAVAAVRKALGQKNNLVVSRAARHAARLELRELGGELVAAFERMMQDAAKSDPQCWAKNDIAKALAGFDTQEPELFLRGMRHVQMEPVWGGQSDSAGGLRGTCALALVVCRELSSTVVLRELTPLFADKDTTVRVNAARAVEQVGSDAAALMLRLRAELGSDEPEVLGACIGGVLRLEGERALEWVAGFMKDGDTLAAEAAFVLAEARTPEAAAVLRKGFDAARDPEFKATLLMALAAMRLEEATAWLRGLAESDGLWAKSARKALKEAGV